MRTTTWTCDKCGESGTVEHSEKTGSTVAARRRTMNKPHTKELDGYITILGGTNKVVIEIDDYGSGTLIGRVELSPEEFCRAALGRLAHTRCRVQLGRLDRIGKMLETQTFTFPIAIKSVADNDRYEIAEEAVKKLCPKGWEPDLSFYSQDSFFTENGNVHARTTIRRWPDAPEGE